MLHKPGTSLPLGPSPFLTGAGPLASSHIDAGGRLRDAGLTVKNKVAPLSCVRRQTERQSGGEIHRWDLKEQKVKKRQVVSSHYVL